MSNSTKTGDPITNLTGRQMVLAAAEPIGASGLAHYVARAWPRSPTGRGPLG